MKLRNILLSVAGLLAVILISSSLYVVREWEQIVITQFGQPVGFQQEARVRRVERCQQSLIGDLSAVIAGEPLIEKIRDSIIVGPDAVLLNRKPVGYKYGSILKRF